MLNRKQLSIFYYTIAFIGIVIILVALKIFLETFEYKTFKDEKAAFKINYPKKWSYAENENGARVIFYSPSENSMDFFRESVNIVVSPVVNAKETSFEQYSKKAIRQMAAVFGDRLNIKEAGEVLLDGRQAFNFVFIGKGKEYDLKYKITWTVVKERAYHITYMSMENQYDTYIADVNRMLHSFKILDKN